MWRRRLFPRGPGTNRGCFRASVCAPGPRGYRSIGFETAKQLAERGFYVVIGARNEAPGQKAAEKIQAAGGKATPLLVDVSRSESIREAASQFRKIADHLDVLINNAGIYPDE